jgi:hypothetical protein
MTEPEWLACADPQPMLEFLRGKVSARKVRLFAVACCLRVWSSLEHEEFRTAVRMAEQFADGVVDQETIEQARQAAIAVFVDLHGKDCGPGAALAAANLPARPKSLAERLLDAFDDPWWEDEFDKGDPLAPAIVTARNAAWAVADQQHQSFATESTAATGEHREQARLLRCLFGNPFRPVTILPSWGSATVLALAQAIYDDRAFDRLPILADALEDAGCANPDILQHCRGGGDHVRGCWPVDLLLAKE